MKILVVKLSDIGDVLTATPALRALRQTFANAQISALVPPNSAGVLIDSPLVDQVLIFDKFRFDEFLQAFQPRNLAYAAGLSRRLRGEGFDTVVIMHHLTTNWGALKFAFLTLATGAQTRIGLDNGKGWFLTQRVKDAGFGARHEAEYWLEVVRLLGAQTSDLQMEITLSSEDERFAAERLVGAGDRCFFAMHAGSGEYSLARRWPLAGFVAVAQALVKNYDARLVLVGGPNERELMAELAQQGQPEATNLAGMTTVKQLGAVLKRCQLFIGNDSGLMHLAAAVGTPVVAIFGPSNSRAWGPLPRNGSTAAVVRVDLPCSPCLYVGHKVGRRNGCEEMTCMMQITPEMVLDAVKKVLSLDERRHSYSGRQGR